jgi:membrane protease YdiL (CAAX protease family)
MLTIILYERDLMEFIKWRKIPLIQAISWRILGALAVVLPFYLLELVFPLNSDNLHPPVEGIGSSFVILIFSLVGNCYEEILFRGFLQGFLLRELRSTKLAILLSSLLFAHG